MNQDGAGRRVMHFDDNRLLPALVGPHDSHLARIEHVLGVTLASRGNDITISGADRACQTAEQVLTPPFA